jgi:molybdopterin synthase sulfur carrier subunit
MTVRVLFFASLKEAVGCESLSIDLPEQLELSAFIDRLAEQLGAHAHQALTSESVRVAVNQELRNGPQVISDGDEVAFLPPVTGG